MSPRPWRRASGVCMAETVVAAADDDGAPAVEEVEPAASMLACVLTDPLPLPPALVGREL